MKTSNCISVAIILMALSIVSYGQGNKTIRLTCNTAIITSANFDNYDVCNFGQDRNVPNKDYLETVARNQGVIWEGVSSNDPENDEINILWIKKEGMGKNFFNKKKIKGNGQPNEKVIATVLSGDPGDTMKYAIKFKVKSGNKNKGPFVIDPKLQI